MQTHEKYNRAHHLCMSGKYKESIELLKPLVAINHKEAVALSGDLYFKLKNYEQAYSFALRTLNNDTNDVSANSKIATMLYHGDLGETDRSKSFQYYIKAAELGHIGCMGRVGNMFELGDGVDVNLDMARRYYRMAGSKGHILSSYLIATTYFRELKIIRGAYYFLRYLIPLKIAKKRQQLERILFY